MYKKGTGNDKQEKDAGNRTLCPYRNFSQAIKACIKACLINTTAKVDDPDKEEVDEMNIINDDYDVVSNIDAVS